MLGCLVVIGGLGFAGYRYGPALLALLRGESSAIAWGLEYQENGLRVKVIAAGMETTGVDDALGSRSGDEDLHLTIEITNMTDATVTYRVPRLVRASDAKLVDDQGRDVQRAVYGDDAKLDGQLYDGEEIAGRRRAKHDLVFKRPPTDAESFVLTVDLGMLGRSESIKFQVPADKVKGLR